MSGLILPQSGRLILGGAAPPAALVATYRAQVIDTGGYTAGTKTGSLTIGSAPTGGDRRYVFMAVLACDGNDPIGLTTGTIQIAGSTVGVEVDANYSSADGARATWSYNEVPTGTTCAYSVNFSGAGSGFAFAMWTVVSDADGIAIRNTYTDTQLSGNMEIVVTSKTGDALLMGAASTDNANGFSELTGYFTRDFNTDTNTDEEVTGWSRNESTGLTSATVTVDDLGTAAGEALAAVVIKPALAA